MELIILWHINPLLGNDSETNNDTTTIAKQQLRKYSKLVEPLLGSGPRATIEILLEAVFSLSQLQVYIIRPTELREITRVEAGSNTSTVTLRVVGGDEKGTQI
jgi:hypothetical protein